MTEPQTITTALISQLVINRIYRDQHKLIARLVQKYNSDGTPKLCGINDTEKYQVIFNRIYIMASFQITGFWQLNEHIIEKGTTSPEVLDTLKHIYEAAKVNIGLFETLPTSTDEHRDIICYKVDEQGNISRLYKRSGDYEGQRFTNSDLYEYCDKVEDCISKILPKDATVKNRHPEKWYSLYHLILIAIGKQVPNFAESGRAEIEKYGSEQYGTGQTFYIELRKIDLNNIREYVVNMTKKDRKSWKSIITDISENNADIITWLSKQPN